MEPYAFDGAILKFLNVMSDDQNLAISRRAGHRRARSGSTSLAELQSVRDHLLDAVDRPWLQLEPVLWAIRARRIKPDRILEELKFWEKDNSDLLIIKLLLRYTEDRSPIEHLGDTTRTIVLKLQRLSDAIERRKSSINSLAKKVRECEETISDLKTIPLSELTNSERRSSADQIQELRNQIYERIASENSLVRESEQALQDDYARFARGELVRFCENNLYALNPRNVANALAGLPRMGWRVSVRKCRKLPCPIGRYHYCLAETIKRVADPSQPAENVVESIRRRLQRMRPSRSNSVAELRDEDNFHRLSQAIRTVGLGCDPCDFPFLIGREYLRIKQNPTRRDLVRQKVAALLKFSTLLGSERP
jgi:hypothetical protein